jgi:ABC-type uncharacterized transport system permease subunit
VVAVNCPARPEDNNPEAKLVGQAPLVFIAGRAVPPALEFQGKADPGQSGMDFNFLLISNLLFLAVVVRSWMLFRWSKRESTAVTWLLLGGGFLAQGGFLYLRGQAFGACPLGTFADVLVFLSWAMVLIYLVIGSAYRLSLLGAFTMPLVLALQLTALVTLRPLIESRIGPPNPWVELHAALSVVAYGAFGLAGVAGLMYLIQEHLLKRHRFSRLFYELPPIQDLHTANGRLLVLGFGLLTVAFISGGLARLPVEALKIWGSLVLWFLYGGLLWLRRSHRVSPRQFARLTVITFLIVMITLPGIHYLSRL